jgi:hypothetical protein
MPKLVILALSAVLAFQLCPAQRSGVPKWFNPSHVDKNGAPIFNSVVLGDTALERCAVLVNYYTIDDNINNPQSSVFMTKSPSLEDYDHFATETNSYFFLVLVGDTCKAMLMLVSETSSGPFHFLITREIEKDPETEMVRYDFTSPNLPILTISRAQELVQSEVGSKMSAMKDKTGNVSILFNGRIHNVLALDRIMPDVIRLVLTKRLYE